MADKRTRDIIYEHFRRRAEKSLASYLEDVVVDCVPEPRQFGSIREGWQAQRDGWLIPALEFVTGRDNAYRGPTRFWLGYTKGHDKSSYIARLLNWGCAFSRRPLRMFCGAKDVKQAGVILDCMKREADLNPWFGNSLTFKKHEVERVLPFGRGKASLEVLASDAGGTQGIIPDVVICDELTRWESFEFFESLYSGVHKRAGHCVLIILTNAGVLGSWQDSIRQQARTNHGSDWWFYEQPPGSKLASWLRQSDIDNDRKLLSDAEAKRLFDNIWVDPTEERGVFRPEDVDACVGPPSLPPPGAKVFLSIDYGETRDRTALAMVWYDGTVLHVVELACWQGSKASPVQVAEVEGWIDRKLSAYPDAVVVIDKHQMVGTEQRLLTKGVRVKRFDYAGGKANYRMAEHLRTLLSNRRMRYAPTAGMLADGTSLADELKSVVYKPMSYGYRLDHDRNDHDDRVVAVGMAALEAVESSPPAAAVQVRQTKEFRPPRREERLVGGGFVTEHFARKGLYGLR